MPRIALLLLSGSVFAAPCWAQEESGREAGGEQEPVAPIAGGTFAPADFARFSPTTALDMVRQIPGFTIQEVDERRGLGQATSNVLINGERISGKSNDAIAALGRISANTVTRIEVRDAATLNVPGLSGQVVNVIADIGGLSGNFSWQPQFRFYNTDPRLFTGEISVSGRQGPVDFTLSLANIDDSFRNGNDGPELAYDGNGALTDRRYEVLTVDGDRPHLSGSFRLDGPGSSVGNLNLSYERYYFRVREDSDRSFPGQVDRHRLAIESENEWNYEIGGDFEFALGPGRLKLIGLRRFEHSPYRQTVTFDFADRSPAAGSRFTRTADEGESILRGEFSWAMAGDWQLALEGARNTLDVESRLFSLDADGDFLETPLPGGTALVSEDRAEANLTYGRPLSPTLTLQLSIGGEYSQISQTGAGGLTRTFYRPKGFVSLAWQPNARLNVRARIEREVGQLDFTDFVASVNVGAGNQNAGNPNLVPPQSWNGELEATRRLGPWGSITTRLFYEAVSDIVDQIPIGADAEAPGNIDSARRYGLEWNSTFNFDPIGLRGAKLDLEVTLQRTRLVDPLTGLPRPISEDTQSYIEAEFRHDLPGTAIAYGLQYERYRQAPGYRLDEFSRFVTRPAFVGVYLEHKDVLGMRVRGTAFNLFGARDDLYRISYLGRRDGPIAFIEDRSRRIGPIFTISLSGSF